MMNGWISAECAGFATSSVEPDHPTGQALFPLWVLFLEPDRMSGLSVRRQASWQHRSKVNAKLPSRVAPTLFVNCRHVRAVKIKLRASGALLSRTATGPCPAPRAATSTQLACPLL